MKKFVDLTFDQIYLNTDREINYKHYGHSLHERMNDLHLVGKNLFFLNQVIPAHTKHILYHTCIEQICLKIQSDYLKVVSVSC